MVCVAFGPLTRGPEELEKTLGNPWTTTATSPAPPETAGSVRTTIVCFEFENAKEFLLGSVPKNSNGLRRHISSGGEKSTFSSVFGTRVAFHREMHIDQMSSESLIIESKKKHGGNFSTPRLEKKQIIFTMGKYLESEADVDQVTAGENEINFKMTWEGM